MKLDSQTFRISEAGSFGSRALLIGALGLAASAGGYFVDSAQFFQSYLVAFVFWTLVGLGGLFLLLIHHLVDATWSVVLRRIFESISVTLPLMAFLFIPVAFGIHDLYHWSHAEVVAADPILQGKAAYLNVPFFIARTAFYFLIWFFLGRSLYKISLKQDKSPDAGQNRRLRQISAPGMVLFALTLTFAAFDWLMSLDPHWYSTIFGVYIYVGSLLSGLAFVILLSQYLRGQGVLADKITVEHYHDLAKLLFAFTVFWTYIAFSQYFLIWYGNIPEETAWFHERWVGSWKIVTMLLVFGHFVFPFLALIPRAAKRSLKWVKIMAVWMLLIHWVDLYWIIAPSVPGHGAEPGVHLSWMDLTTMLGVGGIFLWMFWSRFSSQPLTPVGDSKLDESFKFLNS